MFRFTAGTWSRNMLEGDNASSTKTSLKILRMGTNELSSSMLQSHAIGIEEEILMTSSGFCEAQ